jgi:hypothetical protein
MVIKMRKILYSPSYGSGWVTANKNLPIEAKRFMLEYSPLIEYLENGGEIEREEWDIKTDEIFNDGAINVADLKFL